MRFHGLLPRDAEADGILATVTREPRIRDWLADWKCPVVRMMTSQFDLPYPAVEGDYGAAGRAGARHLLELGHVHYACYSVGRQPDTGEFREGFESELARAGRRVHWLDIPTTDLRLPSRESRSRWLATELKRLPHPLAVAGDDDRRGLELLAACELAGLRVPEDVAVLGCDNHVIEQKLSPLAMSSVDVNFEGIGREAASLLDRLMRGEAAAGGVIKVPPQGVVARQSTATFVTDSPGITAAVVFLREHFPEPLRIAQLARLAGLSKRAFETEFKRRVGRPPREEIQRVRLACAARLLRDTDFKLSAIAVESGLGSASQLCRAFVEAHGASPNAWREQVRNSL
jgi:LacI family transcriptional regulator